jgi:MAF protein
LVLASSSPYRREILAKLGLPFACAASGIDESPLAGETVERMVLRLAESKAQALSPQFPDHLIIGSDQSAVLDGRIMGKPGCRERAVEQLRTASGKTVAFYTALCVLNPASGKSLCDLDITRVTFRALDDTQIAGYVEREQPYDCAGGFKSEGLGVALFERIETEDPNALVGLPLIRLIRLLEAFGVRVI